MTKKTFKPQELPPLLMRTLSRTAAVQMFSCLDESVPWSQAAASEIELIEYNISITL